MTTAMLPPIHHPLEIPQRAVSVIRQVKDAVSALPAPTLPRDVLAATTVGDLAFTHVIDARKDRDIQPSQTYRRGCTRYRAAAVR
ncbi:hypothetical protein A5780_02105 [Nocardia sp. 852002-20019_SCH5090214]|uniref:hypothetical protein n=1 Tax=Nocardia sp. 852002-20019_SCH5090214 TaxID=1834087 RepID=UPI0007E9C1D6|nr:hypothetical protein [Nocardia sp. 852002-20019_SCH5090214]OBA46602.1 hypothetical protein A5780_02105 [Nocardia sp. 852002-20019_SCH5090214]